MDDQVRRFRLAARRHLGGRSGPGIRYPAELHEVAVSYASGRRRRGESLVAISRELGVKPATLTRWLQEAGNSEFRPVEIVTSEQAPLGSGAPAGITVTTPSGMRIRGLDLESLIVLLRGLG